MTPRAPAGFADRGTLPMTAGLAAVLAAAAGWDDTGAVLPAWSFFVFPAFLAALAALALALATASMCWSTLATPVV